MHWQIIGITKEGKNVKPTINMDILVSLWFPCLLMCRVEIWSVLRLCM